MLKFNFLLFILLLWSCQNDHSPIQEGTTVEEVPAPEGQLIEGGEMGPYTLYIASTFEASEASKKLQALSYCQLPQREENDEFYIPPLVTTLFPLGWSADGKFAYAQHTETYNEGNLVTYLIKDMNTNDTLWRQEQYYEMVTDTAQLGLENPDAKVILVKGDESDEDLFKYTWLIDEKMVMAALEKQGVSFNPKAALLDQSNYGELAFEVVRSPIPPTEERVEYTLSSDKYPAQLLYSDYFENEMPKISGILKSPSDETIVVVCWQKRQVFEMTKEIVPFLVGYALEK